MVKKETTKLDIYYYKENPGGHRGTKDSYYYYYNFFFSRERRVGQGDKVQPPARKRLGIGFPIALQSPSYSSAA